MNEVNVFLHQGDLPDDIIINQEVAIDTETMGLNLSRDRLCLLQIKCNDQEVHLVQFDGNDYSAPNLKKILQNKDIVKVFHYARFDILAVYKYLGVMCENIFCTKIASKMCRTYTDKHGLKDLVKDLLGIELQKEQQSSDWGSLLLTEEQKSYAATDVLYLSQLKEILTHMLHRESRYGLATLCFNFLPAKALLDDMGWLDDKDIFNHQ